ncbi:MAG: GxxExxY protein [Candidatus Latescibacteria bacterium]|nr:GxxExxY protein [Candidatus Latescibacterota bacterium]
MVYHELSNKVLKCAFTVHRGLGSGLLESAYEEAVCVELTRAGLRFERQKVYPLFYKSQPIGGYIADLVVENTVILELKAVANIIPIHEAQLLNYLKLSRLPVGYLFNFNGIRLEWRRFANTRGHETQ